MKDQKQILQKLGIETLNPMQQEAYHTIKKNNEVLLLSPTGTGKTLAFLLPLLSDLDDRSRKVQALILVPSRELAMQIEQVAKEMGTGFKVNAIYGGRPIAKDFIDLQHAPSILIGTPGRIADHLRRATFDESEIRFLILDEFDKSLEVGFEGEMREILEYLNVEKYIFTSATRNIDFPEFLEIQEPVELNYLGSDKPKLSIIEVLSPQKDKLQILGELLCHLGTASGIVFCNYKDSINRVSEYLRELRIPHGVYYGALEQHDRERALIKFRNGTHRIIIATDLAARGLDIPEIDFIIHYHLPMKSEEFVHRNGRTARMHASGTAYVLRWEEEQLPEFVEGGNQLTLEQRQAPTATQWTTLFISGGRRDKISKGDIAGLFYKQGKAEKDDIGVIELKSDCAFIGVKKKRAEYFINQLNNSRIKKRKIRIHEI